jgi:hypothetical protein
MIVNDSNSIKTNVFITQKDFDKLLEMSRKPIETDLDYEIKCRFQEYFDEKYNGVALKEKFLPDGDQDENFCVTKDREILIVLHEKEVYENFKEIEREWEEFDSKHK